MCGGGVQGRDIVCNTLLRCRAISHHERPVTGGPAFFWLLREYAGGARQRAGGAGVGFDQIHTRCARVHLCVSGRVCAGAFACTCQGEDMPMQRR